MSQYWTINNTEVRTLETVWVNCKLKYFCMLLLPYTKGGQTFSTEGHIENFIAVGQPHIYILSA